MMTSTVRFTNHIAIHSDVLTQRKFALFHLTTMKNVVLKRNDVIDTESRTFCVSYDAYVTDLQYIRVYIMKTRDKKFFVLIRKSRITWPPLSANMLLLFKNIAALSFLFTQVPKPSAVISMATLVSMTSLFMSYLELSSVGGMPCFWRCMTSYWSMVRLSSQLLSVSPT